MSKRHGYAQIGTPEDDARAAAGAGTKVMRAGLSRGAQAALTVAVVLAAISIALNAVTMYFGYTSWEHNKDQDRRMTNIESAASDEAATRAAMDTSLAVTDATIQSEVDDRIASLNGVHGENATHNVDLVVNGTGFSVTADPDNHRVLLRNGAVLNVNGVPPTEADGTLNVVGEGMIEIDNDVNASTVTVNATAIVEQLSNLQAQVSMQQILILELEQNATLVETVVNALVNALTAISGGANSTEMLNQTIAQLVTDVATATANVAVIQSQIANLTMNEPMPGMLVPWSGASGGPIPSGWLLCDGTEYNITDYPSLYAVVGTMYCNGPCSSLTVFAVPDMRGRVPVHKGGTVLNGAVGTKVGTETHTLSTTEMPTHAHTGTTNTDGAHGHRWFVHAGTGGHASSGPGVACSANAPFGGLQVNDIGSISCGDTYINEYWTGLQTDSDQTFGNYPPSSPVHAHAFTTNSAGSGSAHNNLQPSLVMQYIIKT